tara:strand:- start:307 stop:552 length:246 start_codon:yes stop_codon:yes gene_type:complete
MANNKYWEKYGNKHLKGRTIVDVRYLTTIEMKGMGWYRKSIVLELSDGSLLFPSKDDEGNDAGALFGQSPDNKSLTFPVIS